MCRSGAVARVGRGAVAIESLQNRPNLKALAILGYSEGIFRQIYRPKLKACTILVYFSKFGSAKKQAGPTKGLIRC